MRTTQYNCRITIKSPTQSTSEVGGLTNAWTTLYTSWAGIKPVKGIKRLEYGQLGFTKMYEVEMLKRVVNVNSTCQVLYGGEAYQIQSLYMDSDKVYMDIVRKQ
jgi:SPP1 family predicted phage head-tail adaptor